ARLSCSLGARSGIAPVSSHLIAESSTAIRPSGRPVVTCQARSTLMPRTPNSSAGLLSIVGSPVCSLVSFHSLPPVKSIGRTGGAVTGRGRDDEEFCGGGAGGGAGGGGVGRGRSPRRHRPRAGAGRARQGAEAGRGPPPARG